MVRSGKCQVVLTKEDVVECLEALKGDASLCARPLKLIRHNLDHLLLLLLRDGGGVEQVSAEVRLGDVVLGVLSVPEK